MIDRLVATTLALVLLAGPVHDDLRIHVLSSPNVNNLERNVDGEYLKPSPIHTFLERQ